MNNPSPSTDIISPVTSGVNRDISDLAEPGLGSWDHMPGDPVALGCLDLHTKKDLRLLVVNQPSEYAKLPEGEKAVLQAWIRERLVPASSPGRYSSYGLKHTFEDSDGGSYVNNGQFKGAMLVAGYEPLNRYDLNWMFAYDAVEEEPVKRRRRPA